jgi:hypothetical protein
MLVLDNDGMVYPAPYWASQPEQQGLDDVQSIPSYAPCRSNFPPAKRSEHPYYRRDVEVSELNSVSAFLALLLLVGAVTPHSTAAVAVDSLMQENKFLCGAIDILHIQTCKWWFALPSHVNGHMHTVTLLPAVQARACSALPHCSNVAG